MLIENPKTGEEIYIYSARLTFTKEKNENEQVYDKVRVIIYYNKKGPKRKKDLLVPKEINTFNLSWRRFKGKPVSEYHRTGNSENYSYAPKSESNVSTGLCQKLEHLVSKVCFEEIIRYTKLQDKKVQI